MAGITTTQTFSDGDTVTAAKLNNIIANASIDNGAITNAKLGTDAVTLTKMANNSVDTAELIDDAVANSKLATMEKRRVKVNATDATANPTDLFVDANELLVGTSSTINAVSFSDDLALDNAGATASKIIAAPSLINGKSTVAASNLDELLLYDQDATSVLKKTTAGSIVASLKATDSQSGSAELATSAELISTSGAPTNAVVGAAIGSPMLAKAWCYFTSNIAAYNTSPAASQVTTVSSSAFNIAVGDHTTDGTTTTTGGVQQTAVGTYKVYFTTALPNTNYIVTGNGNCAAIPKRHVGIRVGTKNTAYFTFEVTSSDNDSFLNAGEFQLVVFGLGS
jgi:hypothetical protein